MIKTCPTVGHALYSSGRLCPLNRPSIAETISCATSRACGHWLARGPAMFKTVVVPSPESLRGEEPPERSVTDPAFERSLACARDDRARTNSTARSVDSSVDTL